MRPQKIVAAFPNGESDFDEGIHETDDDYGQSVKDEDLKEF